MWQRIQSLYLLAVTALLVTALCLPVGRFIQTATGAVHLFKPWRLLMADGGTQPAWGLGVILLLAAVTAFCTIFLFRNRMLQVRMTIFGSLLMVGYYLVFIAFFFIMRRNLAPVSFRMGWALCLPIVCIILNYLAFRAIYRDEFMVRAADRLR
ncbi:MAG: DUF4293 domain-containing protein [Prevotellaceae bacterium]|nr:DUF4293 domain-containing protein [Prevotellaceae bacterium]